MPEDPIIVKIKKYIKKVYFEYTEKGGGKGYRYFHALRVSNMASKYASQTKDKINTKALTIACLLHDIGRINDAKDNVIDLDVSEKNHCEKGANIAENLLKELNEKDKGLIKYVKKIILLHHSTNSDIKEVKILQNSDDVDEMGGLMVWRMFGYAIQMGEPPTKPVVYWKNEISKVKSKIETNLTIPFFKSLALKRLDRCNNFVKDFQEELESKS